MSIYISNALYISEVSEVFMRRNRPLIGYHSVLRRNDFSFSHFGYVNGSGTNYFENATNAWSPLTRSTARIRIVSSTEGMYQDFAFNLNNSTNESINYIGIAAHTFGSTNVEFKLQYGYEGFAGADSFTDAFDYMTVGNDNSLIFHIDDIQAPFWRIRFRANHFGTEDIKIGHIRLGRILQLERPMYVGIKPFGLGSESQGFNMESDNGNYLGQVITSRRRNWEIRQPNNTPEFTRENVYDFINHLNGFGNGSGNGPKGTFFGAWRPDDYPTEVIYGWKDIEDDVYPANSKSNGMMEWNARGKAIL